MENQEKEKLGRFFFHTLQKLVHNKNKLDRRLLDYQFDIFQSVIIDLTGTEKLLFNTLFARIAFLGIQLKLPPGFIYELHLYRKEVQFRKQFRTYEEVYQLGLYLIGELIQEHYDVELTEDLKNAIACPDYQRNEPKLDKFIHSMRGIVTYFNAKSGTFGFVGVDHPEKEELVSTLNMELFQSSIQQLDEWQKNDDLPVTVVLREVGVDKQGYLYPKWIVLAPDYLVDVTAIAECFAPSGARPEFYLLNKFLPTTSSKYLLIGHIVNFLLDELVNNLEVSFDTILKQIFKLAPLSLSLIEEKELVEIVQTVKQHYLNLVRVLQNDFTQLELDVGNCVIEPSFYAPELGLQGRLDVLHMNDSMQSSIIELKSGSPFRENRYGLSSNHYTQTLLYDLMIRSVFQMRTKPLNYILYSKLPQQNLRFAPTIRAAQMEAVSVRNEIYAIERKLAEKKGRSQIEGLKLVNFPGVFGFLKEDIEIFEQCYTGLDTLEKAYFQEMTSFVALEHHYAKTGLLNHKENKGLSALWLEGSREKEERFAIFTHLQIVQNDSMKEPPVLVLEKTEDSNELANFRVGDIVVIRPESKRGKQRISGQIIRAGIVEFRDQKITVKLRSKQYDQRYYQQHNFWNMEPDFLDSGFRKMYQSIYSFSNAPENTRKLLLGRRAPEEGEQLKLQGFEKLTQNQIEVLTKLLSSPEYFLLWGPPGTGKTSVMLAAAVAYLLEQTDQQILLLAYTNRAVDEICEMIEQLPGKPDYIRVGSRYSTGEAYRARLLANRLDLIDTRKALRELIDKTRLFVATTSSLSGKMELFGLKTFDVVFVDEASQILEPMIIGMLPQFRKFVLIGDHRQLPAVVVQSKAQSQFKEGSLAEIGIRDGRVSFFDRLFQQCKDHGWNHATGQLFEQGRMHEQVMKFPGAVFYDKRLQILGGNLRQEEKYSSSFANQFSSHYLINHRMLFVHVEGDPGFALAKNNVNESETVISIISELEKIYRISGREVSKNSIGVITPFRAQIAQIRNDMSQHGIDPDRYSVDTVERYQGGARDIIIYSTVVNSEKRLEQIISTESNGLDRKLNVAVTRAREQFILVGNKTILKENELYSLLIDHCVEKDISEDA